MGKQVFKIALPEYNAQTDTDPNHFSLFVDQEVDYVLIKEKIRGELIINTGGYTQINHGLGYIPFCLAFMDIGGGVWQRLYGVDYGVGDTGFTVSNQNLIISNYSGKNRSFKYFIFLDDITEV